MVTDLAWHGFGDRTEALVRSLLAEHFQPKARAHQRMLSVVMPGHSIHPHSDAQGPHWLARVHVPLVTNESAVFVANGEPHHMPVGGAYAIDTRVLHEVWNRGDCPRIHLMFDVLS